MNNERLMKVSIIIALVFASLAALWLFWGEEKYKQYEMFTNARHSGNVFKYEEYCRYYSNGRYSDIMRDSVIAYYERSSSIMEIQKAAQRNQYNTVGKRLNDLVVEKADKGYAKAISSGSVVELERFVNDCPAEFQKDARTILEEMAWANDTVAWETAQRRNTTAAYQTYLDRYCRGGGHTKEAVDIMVRMLSSGNTDKLGDLHKTGGSGSSSSVRIKNSTCHKMSVYFSGQNSKYMTLESFDSGTVRLGNGQYDVVATVDDPMVIPYKGTYKLDGGGYYVDLSIQYQFFPGSTFTRFPL